MIKLSRQEVPEELTAEVIEELTKLYKEDKYKDVWNSPKVKNPIKTALMDMSFSKCAYCECELGIESKDATIDHFKPKSKNEELVISWENLFPACLRCNRAKNNKEDVIINPCEDEPKEYLGLRKRQPFRLKGIDTTGIGTNTIDVLGLNDVDRVMTARMKEWEKIWERMNEICEDLRQGFQIKYVKKFEKIMKLCLKNNAYSAIKSSNLLNDDVYNEIKENISSQGKWTQVFVDLEEQLKKVALQLVE